MFRPPKVIVIYKDHPLKAAGQGPGASEWGCCKPLVLLPYQWPQTVLADCLAPTQSLSTLCMHTDICRSSRLKTTSKNLAPIIITIAPRMRVSFPAACPKALIDPSRIKVPLLKALPLFQLRVANKSSSGLNTGWATMATAGTPPSTDAVEPLSADQLEAAAQRVRELEQRAAAVHLEAQALNKQGKYAGWQGVRAACGRCRINLSHAQPGTRALCYMFALAWPAHAYVRCQYTLRMYMYAPGRQTAQPRRG